MQLSFLVLRVLITVHPCVTASYSAPEVSWEAAIALKLQCIIVASSVMLRSILVGSSQCFQAPCKPLLPHFAKKTSGTVIAQRIMEANIHQLYLLRSALQRWRSFLECNMKVIFKMFPTHSLVCHCVYSFWELTYFYLVKKNYTRFKQGKICRWYTDSKPVSFYR